MRRPNWRNYRKMIIRRSIFRVMCFVGALIFLFGFFYLIRTVGHYDIASDIGYSEKVWGILNYVKHLIGSFIIIGVGTLTSVLGDYFKNLISDWIDNFETKWNVQR